MMDSIMTALPLTLAMTDLTAILIILGFAVGVTALCHWLFNLKTGLLSKNLPKR